MRSPHEKALKATHDKTTKRLHVKDEGYGNTSHLSKTVKRGVARMGKGGAYGGNHGVSHWSKEQN